VIDSARKWDPTSGMAWAKVLGMVHVPMFGASRPRRAAEEAAILLDGSRGSFAFMRTEDARFADTMEPLSWSWSSCVRHMVTVLPGRQRMYVRRWDEPQTISKFEMPRQGMGAFSLLEKLEAAREPRRPNVVRHVLEPFRQIRLRIGAQDSLLAVQLLNGLLLVADVARKRARAGDIEGIRTFGDAFKLLSIKDREICGLVDIPRETAALDARDLVQGMVDPVPDTGCELHPTLLFRHAASRLYQEAHLEIERNPQGYFPGLEPTHEPVGAASPRDVRFTPPNLARALVQKALEAMPDRRRDLTILDPACGSGVFLVEAIRELSAGGDIRSRKIKAVGYDISDISEYTTRFCLEYATHDGLGSHTVQTEVVKRDSLEDSWVNADIILMNPPFIPWERLTAEQKRKVGIVLGDAFTKRPDIAMAFVSRAVEALTSGGVLGCVLPAALLMSETGLAWRKWLSTQGSLQLVGCFEGYKYFPTSLVETAFLIYQKRAEQEHKAKPVEVLISDEGSEDAALRALRLKSEAALSIKGVERFKRPLQAFSPQSWRPLRENAYKEKDRLAALALPRVDDLFKIKQGVRTGNNRVFVLKVRQYEELGRRERKFFRPVAGGGSIRNGQLRTAEYVFYPYATDGRLLWTLEGEVKESLPTYYAKYLVPAKSVLASRARFSDRKWWELSEKRAWQATPAPRLISTYFGESGSFAFDEDGEYITVNGHAWFWAKESVALSEDTQVPFEQTPAVWAYLAILNSKAFEEIMSLFTVRLQGGQMRLEARFLSQVPLPDVTDEMSCPAGVVQHLVELGKGIHAGELKGVATELDKRVSLLYGLEER
jgi:adenine-specific DNA-methyltransferase